MNRTAVSESVNVLVDNEQTEWANFVDQSNALDARLLRTLGEATAPRRVLNPDVRPEVRQQFAPERYNEAQLDAKEAPQDQWNAFAKGGDNF